MFHIRYQTLLFLSEGVRSSFNFSPIATVLPTLTFSAQMNIFNGNDQEYPTASEPSNNEALCNLSQLALAASFPEQLSTDSFSVSKVNNGNSQQANCVSFSSSSSSNNNPSSKF